MVKSRRMPSVMKHTFSQVPSAKIQRSSFDRSCGYKTTFNAGDLIPIFVDEVLPGDTFSLSENFIARMATPIFPLMDNLRMDTQYFYVPLRLVWENFQKFCGETEDPVDYSKETPKEYVIPTMEAPAKPSPTPDLPNPEGGYATGSLEDYFGLPTHIPGYKHSSLWHRAYNLIWNEYYRDENLQDSVTVLRGDTELVPDGTAGSGKTKQLEYKVLKRGKRYDYFTSCLPWPQKGNPVSISIAGTDGGKLPISGYVFEEANPPLNPGTWSLDNVSPTSSTFYDSLHNQLDGFKYPPQYSSGPDTQSGRYVYRSASLRIATPPDTLATKPKDSGSYATVTTPPQLYVDLGKTAAVTINDLRTAFQIQRLLERDARGGTRYIEIVRSHFNVQSPDARLQRPEYLGGSITPVNISPIAQTSSTSDKSPQGNLAAYATASSSKKVFTKSFVEHGVIIGLASVRADLNYQQGLPRMWSRKTRWDFYWPALAHLGEQAVLNKEIYCQGTKADSKDDEVFGYQERYAEYRYKTSMVTGLFRSNALDSKGKPQTLDSWHLAQNFKSLPTLSSQFIEENPPMERVLAVKTGPDFLLDAWFKLRCARPMPVYSVPGLIDHF